MTNVIAMPVSVLRNANLSAQTRIVFAELTLLPQGNEGEFVVKSKELASLLNISVGTLKRSILSLEENGLIQCVGQVDEQCEKYVFKGQNLEEQNPPAPSRTLQGINKGGFTHDKSDITVSPSFSRYDEEIDVEPRAKPSPQSNWMAMLLAAPRRGEPKPVFEEPELPKKSTAYITRWDAYAGVLLLGHEISWKQQFPRLNGKDGRPTICRELVCELLAQWSQEGQDRELLAFMTLKLKILSGEKIRPIPVMSSEEYLEAINKKEKYIMDSLGPEEGKEMLQGLAGEWGYLNYEQSKMDPKTRPGIARAIAAV